MFRTIPEMVARQAETLGDRTGHKGIEAAYLLDKSRAKALFTVTGFVGVDYLAGEIRLGGGICSVQTLFVDGGYTL